jgi:hypothetical protein
MVVTTLHLEHEGTVEEEEGVSIAVTATSSAIAPPPLINNDDSRSQVSGFFPIRCSQPFLVKIR